MLNLFAYLFLVSALAVSSPAFGAELGANDLIVKNEYENPPLCNPENVKIVVSLTSLAMIAQYEITEISNNKQSVPGQATCVIKWNSNTATLPKPVLNHANSSRVFRIALERPVRITRTGIEFELPTPQSDRTLAQFEAEIEIPKFKNMSLHGIDRFEQVQRTHGKGKLLVKASTENEVALSHPIRISLSKQSKNQQINWQVSGREFAVMYPNLPKYKRPKPKRTIFVWGSTVSEMPHHQRRMDILEQFLSFRDPSSIDIYTASTSLEKHSYENGYDWRETLNSMAPIVYEGAFDAESVFDDLAAIANSNKKGILDIVLLLDDLNTLSDTYLENRIDQLKKNNIYLMLYPNMRDRNLLINSLVSDFRITLLDSFYPPTKEQVRLYPWTYSFAQKNENIEFEQKKWVFPKEGILGSRQDNSQNDLVSIKFVQGKIGHRELFLIDNIPEESPPDWTQPSATSAVESQKINEPSLQINELGSPMVNAALSHANSFFIRENEEGAVRSLSSLLELDSISPFAKLAAANHLKGWGRHFLADSSIAKDTGYIGTAMQGINNSIDSLGTDVFAYAAEDNFSCSENSNEKRSIFKDQLTQSICQLQRLANILPAKTAQDRISNAPPHQHMTVSVISVGLSSIQVELIEPVSATSSDKRAFFNRQLRVTDLAGPVSLSSFWLPQPYSGQYRINIARKLPATSIDSPISNRIVIGYYDGEGRKEIQKSLLLEPGANSVSWTHSRPPFKDSDAFEPEAASLIFSAHQKIRRSQFHAAIGDVSTIGLLKNPNLESKRLLTLGKAHLAIGNLSTTARLFADARRLAPYDQSVGLYLSEMAAMKGDGDKAAALITQYIESKWLASFNGSYELLRRLKHENNYLPITKHPAMTSLVRGLEESISSQWPLHQFMSQSSTSKKQEQQR